MATGATQTTNTRLASLDRLGLLASVTHTPSLLRNFLIAQPTTTTLLDSRAYTYGHDG